MHLKKLRLFTFSKSPKAMSIVSPLTPKVEKCSDWAENLTTDSSRYSKNFIFLKLVLPGVHNS
jgi:hypothetical protein